MTAKVTPSRAPGSDEPTRTPAPHPEPIELKCWSISFQAMKNGAKRFEYRKDDRPYDTGVTLWQREWNPDTGYTGDNLFHDVTFIIRGGVFGIPEGYCIMSVSEPRGCASHSASSDVLEKIVSGFILKNEIGSSETIYQCDHVIEGACEFIESLCDVVGYFDYDTKELRQQTKERV
jgi:hypothetical protein